MLFFILYNKNNILNITYYVCLKGMSTMNIIISNSMNGYLTNSDLIKSEATIQFKTDRQTLNTGGILFSILENDYNFSLEVMNMHIYLKRNHNVCIFDVSRFDFDTYGDNLVIFCIWTPTVLKIYLREETRGIESYLIYESLEISYFVTPYRVIHEAYRQNLVLQHEYESAELFRQQCHEIFQKVQLIIDKHPSKDIFWNIIKEGKKIINKKPKNETDLHAAIYYIIFDTAITSNIEVIPEYTTGVGNVDFVFIGKLTNHDTVKMCVEFKRAHATDLEHGLKVQLPAYMQNTNADYGVFGIFGFKGNFFDKPKNSLHDLELELGRWKEPISNNIRIFTYDLSHQTSASKI